MTLSQGLTYTLAAALVALSLREMLAPRAAALGYGVPVPEGTAPTPYLETKANRDLVLAGLIAAIAYERSSLLAGALVFSTIAPLADAWTVARHGKRSDTVVHLSTAAYSLVAAALAASGR